MAIYPEPTNMTGMFDMFQYANTVTNNTFVGLLILSAWVVPLIFLILKNPSDHNNTMNAFIAAGWIATMMAVLLRVSELLTVDKYVWVAVAMLIIPLIIKYVTDTSS